MSIVKNYTLLTYPEFWPPPPYNYVVRFEGARKAAASFHQEVDCLFIDGDHHKIGVEMDLELWGSKVKKGQPIFFHDYGSSWEGVKQAVDESKILIGDTLVDYLMLKYKI